MWRWYLKDVKLNQWWLHYCGIDDMGDREVGRKLKTESSDPSISRSNTLN